MDSLHTCPILGSHRWHSHTHNSLLQRRSSRIKSLISSFSRSYSASTLYPPRCSLFCPSFARLGRLCGCCCSLLLIRNRLSRRRPLPLPHSLHIISHRHTPHLLPPLPTFRSTVTLNRSNTDPIIHLIKQSVNNVVSAGSQPHIHIT